METQNTGNQEAADRTYGRRLGGIVLLGVGSVLLAHEAGAALPEWLFTWQMIVIIVGLFIGAKHRFRDWGWLIPVAVGVVFLANEYVDGFSIDHYFWPIIIIAVGLSMLVTRRHHSRRCG